MKPHAHFVRCPQGGVQYLRNGRAVLKWHASPHRSTPATCPRSARRSTWARRRSRTGRRCSSGYEFSRRWMTRPQARRDLPGLQRPRHVVQPGDDPDLRDRHRGRVPDRRRRLGPAAGAQGVRPCRAGRAHRAERDPGRLRPHAGQQDGRRPRPDGAAVAVVRSGECVAVPGDPVRGQRGAVPHPVGPALLHAGPGDPQGDRVVRRAAQRAGLGHRRHEPPAAGSARGADQQGVGQPLPRPPDRRSGGPGAGAAHRIRARGRQRRHRAGDVADRARRDGRLGRRARRPRWRIASITCRHRTPPWAI